MMGPLEVHMAKTLIIYTTKYGTTQTCAALLKAQLRDGADLQNLSEHKKVKLDAYDTIVIGTSIHAGMINGRIKRFCAEHEQDLLKKRLGLFLCMMEEGEGAVKQLEQKYSQALRDKALVVDSFGGEFLFSKMGWFARKLIKSMSKTDEDVHQIREDAIKAFAQVLNS